MGPPENIWLSDEFEEEENMKKAKPRFKLGQKVWKMGGRYGGPGRIVGETMELDDRDGYFLYNVAMKVEGGYGEFVHVFPESVLRETAE